MKVARGWGQRVFCEPHLWSEAWEETEVGSLSVARCIPIPFMLTSKKGDQLRDNTGNYCRRVKNGEPGTALVGNASLHLSGRDGGKATVFFGVPTAVWLPF